MAKSKSRVVEATGSAASFSNDGPNAKMIEEAMSEAVAAAQADGITDPEEIRQRQLDARERVKQDFKNG